jgi:uncharacterized peroxidase-related enzyme
VTHHGASFARLIKNEALAAAVLERALDAPLEPADMALVRYATDLTQTSHGDANARVAALRAAGFGDAAILHATEITGYFNFINRMASGLGVELEEG